MRRLLAPRPSAGGRIAVGFSLAAVTVTAGDAASGRRPTA
ncbi:hypothetical protein BKA21_002153 [Cellulomonas oligotrophica]|uniref:Uncharacterized protein n=1 Tax=Cellulomonas oligotrophica TaxID=931536 RepID=A0A7Y9FFV2_9CELL|nr:hypothetical protein [Cellulomonas oligotrophica]TQL02258.1 hypothetical protein FBY24_1330 [Cellulomonas sp. SLBN-39]